MKYLRILMACAAEPWAIERAKLRAICDFLAFQAAGGKFDGPEIEARISQKRDGEVRRENGTVAVLPIFGVLSQRMDMLAETSGGTSVERVHNAFMGLLADEQTKAIVLHFDSPGGNIHGIEEFAQDIFEARGIKPIVAQVDSLAASAAYWLASSADEVVVTPGGAAGSIGVFAVHEEISAALEQAGIKRTLIASSDSKGAINNFQPLSDDAKAEIQERVDFAASVFTKAVARGRGVTAKAVNEQFGQGRMFDAPQLVRRGMADRVAPMRATLERFGAITPIRRAGANAARAALAAGLEPAAPDLENLLREQGAPRSLATLIAARGGSMERRSESGEAKKQGVADGAKRFASATAAFSLSLTEKSK